MDWNESALTYAEKYVEDRHPSKQSIDDVLVSRHGGWFMPAQAQYAVDALEIDWEANALETARAYRAEKGMTDHEIREQLVVEGGDRFTEDEADYAIEHLQD